MVARSDIKRLLIKAGTHTCRNSRDSRRNRRNCHKSHNFHCSEYARRKSLKDLGDFYADLSRRITTRRIAMIRTFSTCQMNGPCNVNNLPSNSIHINGINETQQPILAFADNCD